MRMPPAPLKVAVIGAGYFGRFHAQKFAALPDVRLVAVADPDLERARAAAAAHGAEACADHRALEGRVDAVSIAAATTVHFPIARFFLERDVHCFVEKPIATTVEEARTLVDLAARQRRILQVGHIQRVLFNALGGRALVRRPRLVEAARVAPYRTRATDVGVVLDLMIHDIDLALAAIDGDVVNVMAAGGAVVSRSEDYCSARLIFAGGEAASLTASRVCPETERTMRIYGPEGQATLDLQRRTAAILRKDGGTLVRDDRTAEAGDDLASELAGFVASIRTGARPIADGTDGLRALDVATRILAQIGGR